jgi:predicted tellurium resistance membrane protein TerC
MLELLSDPAVWASLATLTLMEIVLGIDNIIFISILSTNLPEDQQRKARLVGLSLAGITRLLLLLAITWLAQLTAPWFHLFGHPVSGRDLILLLGGAFLVYKATTEIHAKLEGEDTNEEKGPNVGSFVGVVTQIVLLDIIFSLDSVITAIGMSDHLTIMMAAVIVALGFMVLIGNSISNFVLKHPTVKMLALSFLLLIGVSLAAEAFGREIPKGYIYSAMAFSIFVESMNLIVKKRREKKTAHRFLPVQLKQNVVGVRLNSPKTPTTEPERS